MRHRALSWRGSEEYCFLECDYVYFGRNLLTFRCKFLLSHSGREYSSAVGLAKLKEALIFYGNDLRLAKFQY